MCVKSKTFENMDLITTLDSTIGNIDLLTGVVESDIVRKATGLSSDHKNELSKVLTTTLQTYTDGLNEIGYHKELSEKEKQLLQSMNCELGYRTRENDSNDLLDLSGLAELTELTGLTEQAAKKFPNVDIDMTLQSQDYMKDIIEKTSHELQGLGFPFFGETTRPLKEISFPSGAELGLKISGKIKDSRPVGLVINVEGWSKAWEKGIREGWVLIYINSYAIYKEKNPITIEKIQAAMMKNGENVFIFDTAPIWRDPNFKEDETFCMGVCPFYDYQESIEKKIEKNKSSDQIVKELFQESIDGISSNELLRTIESAEGNKEIFYNSIIEGLKREITSGLIKAEQIKSLEDTTEFYKHDIIKIILLPLQTRLYDMAQKRNDMMWVGYLMNNRNKEIKDYFTYKEAVDTTAAVSDADVIVNVSFGKIMKPYIRYMKSATVGKGVVLETKFGAKKLRDDRRGLFLKANDRKYYIYNWPKNN